jgi:myo-inositol-1(or 4)-monophosphatase
MSTFILVPRPVVALPSPVWQKPGVLDFERAAHSAVARAGALIRARHRDRPSVLLKSEVDLVTPVDRDAEAIIVEALSTTFPQDGIVAEESPPRPGSGNRRWFVDPLDGTTNFAHGYPHFAVSLALEIDGRLTFGIVYDPMREETFTATRGRGARLNGAPIFVSGTSRLAEALLGTGFPYDRRRDPDGYLSIWRVALLRARGVRRAGSAALDLCYVAAGRLEGFWEQKLHVWDLAAGRLILEEAGGRVTDFGGAPHCLEGAETAASNGHVHGELLQMIAAARGAGRAVGHRDV